LKEAVLASKQAVQILSCYGLAHPLLSQPLHVARTTAGFEDQLGNDVNDIIDWGVQVTGSRLTGLHTVAGGSLACKQPPAPVQVLAPQLTDAVESFIIVCTPLAGATTATTGTEEETSTTEEQSTEGLIASAWWLGVVQTPGKQSPDSTC
jgi:hypothetical protein